MKRKFRHIIAILIVLTLLFTGCGNSDQAVVGGNSSTGKAAEKSVYSGVYECNYGGKTLYWILSDDGTFGSAWTIDEVVSSIIKNQNSPISANKIENYKKDFLNACGAPGDTFYLYEDEGTYRAGEGSIYFSATPVEKESGSSVAMLQAWNWMADNKKWVRTFGNTDFMADYNETAEVFTCDTVESGVHFIFKKIASDGYYLLSYEQESEAHDSLIDKYPEFYGISGSVPDNDQQTGTGVTNGQTEPIGSLKTLEDLNIRNGPGTNYSTTGVLKKGNTARYYEVKNAGGYTWYRIGDNSWIANDGTWLEVDSDVPVSAQPAADETMIQEKALQMVKDYAKITESRADSSFEWNVYETDSNTYHVSYEGDPFSGVVVISADVVYDPVTDKLEGVITQDNRGTYDPDKDYWAETEAHFNEPYVEPEYTEQEAAVIKAVEEHCAWWNKFLSANPANERTKGGYWVWYVEEIGTDAWHVELGHFSMTSGANPYACDVVWNGSQYVITDTVDWISDTL